MSNFTADNMQIIENGFNKLLAEEPPLKSNEQLVGKYINQIKAALDKGWPIEAVIQVLEEGGVKIQANTLRSYIQRQKNRVSQVVANATTCSTPPDLGDTPAAANGEKPKRKRNKKKEGNKPVNGDNQNALIDSNAAAIVDNQKKDGSFELDSDDV